MRGTSTLYWSIPFGFVLGSVPSSALQIYSVPFPTMKRLYEWPSLPQLIIFFMITIIINTKKFAVTSNHCIFFPLTSINIEITCTTHPGPCISSQLQYLHTSIIGCFQHFYNYTKLLTAFLFHIWLIAFFTRPLSNFGEDPCTGFASCNLFFSKSNSSFMPPNFTTTEVCQSRCHSHSLYTIPQLFPCFCQLTALLFWHKLKDSKQKSYTKCLELQIFTYTVLLADILMLHEVVWSNN